MQRYIPMHFKNAINGIDEGHVIYFFTSRTEAHREVTERWLKKMWFQISWNHLRKTARWQLSLDRQSHGARYKI
jgi:hypothetical protein